jgi:DmsE family decaheme c-type cytochrome
MRIKRAMAALALGFFGLVGTGWAAGMDAAASAACVECHDAEDMPDMSRSAHAVATDPRTPTCVTCHGPSPGHVKKEAGKGQAKPDRMFTKAAPTPIVERNIACLQCHQKDSKRALWGGSQHESADLACATCHKIHTNNDKVLARAGQTELCITCHKEQRTQVAKPSHHPVPEGKMTCSDCHNVHGSAGPKLAKRESTNATCYACHAEKRGPFVFGHEPVNEDCAICHNPHGSTVQGMLKARAPILCQQCHVPHVAGGVGAVGGQPGVFPPAAPGQLSPASTGTTNGKNVVNIWQGRSCMNCHTQVHGSNNPSATNPTPRLFFR